VGEFQALAAGASFTCGLDTSGKVDCWGAGFGGFDVLPTGQFSSIFGGVYHACALRDDGSAECWGNTAIVESVEPAAGPFVSLALGGRQTYGLREDGSVDYWGHTPILDPDYYRSGEHDFAAPPGQYMAIAASVAYACGARADHTVVCWGGRVTVPRD